MTCKGIGPGPPDTIHLGCCSQLALFVAKDYTKQPDLDLNSLALVASKLLIYLLWLLTVVALVSRLRVTQRAMERAMESLCAIKSEMKRPAKEPK